MNTNSIIENGSFETGTFSGWETIGATRIRNANFGVEPTEGTFQALLTTGTIRSSSPVSDSDLEDFSNLSPGELDNLGNGDAVEGSAIQQTFTANAGDILTFDWNFLTNEATPDEVFNDFAFFSLTDLTQELADTQEPIFFDTLARGFNEETGFQTATVVISETGTYNLDIGVVDVSDNSVNSALLIDNVQLNTDDGDPNSSEPNDTIPDAIATNLSGPGIFNISSEIGDNFALAPEDDVDLFELELNAGEQLIADIDASDIGSGLDPILTVFDSSGSLVAQNDDSNSLDSFIDFTANFDDTYYVGVSSFANFGYDPFTEGSGTGSGGSSGFYDLSLTIEPEEPTDSDFDIEVIFTDDTLTPSQQAVFADAAARWEEIITGDLPDVVFPDLGLVDDVAIEASAPFIDGPGGILGQAGPTALRTDTLLPARGIMEFDSADLISLENDGLLEAVILHEMGHVLGIGTIWQDLGLLTGAGSSDPRFTGAAATAEYNNIFGVNEDSVPVENIGGPGTANAHWRESIFDNELMTGFINFGDNPLSRITAASLEDLGYEVNLDAADPYTAPSSSVGIQSTNIGNVLAMDNKLDYVNPIAGYDNALDIEPELV